MLAVCAVAFIVGLVVGARHTPAGQGHAERFATAWEHGDYAAMYSELTAGDRGRVPRARFIAAYQDAMSTATAAKVDTAEPRKDGDAYRVPVQIPTRAFGTVAGEVVLPATGDGIDWSRALVFPGLAAGERLRRVTRMPTRATLLARDRTVLAKGDDRASASLLAPQVVGQLGPIPPERRDELAALGVPADAEVGVSGLERIFDERLLGTPGGELVAGARVLKRTRPRQAAAVRTTISLPVEQAAVTALGGRLGGIVALAPRTGEVLAFSGIAFSGLQPPGSTFKMVTTTGALEAGITNPQKTYPVQTKAVLEGVDLENANGEYCGGSLIVSFAKSCNSVFAPLGRRSSAPSASSPPPSASASTRRPTSPARPRARSRPPARSATTSRSGRRPSARAACRRRRCRWRRSPPPSACAGAGPTSRSTTPPPTAAPRAPSRPPRRAWRARWSASCWPSCAAAPASAPRSRACQVAGKTGTAELRTTKKCQPDPENPESCPPEDQANDPTDTDAWFAAYAPAGKGRPHVAVGVLLVASGAGGDTAAPAARDVLLAGLKATR